MTLAALASEDITLDTPEQTVTVAAGETIEWTSWRASRQYAQGQFDVSVSATYGDYDLADAGVVQVVPAITAPAMTAARQSTAT